MAQQPTTLRQQAHHGRGSAEVPIERLLKLHADKLSYRAIAQEVGGDVANVYRRIKHHEASQEGTELYKLHRGDIFAALQERLISSLSDDEIQKMAPRDRILGVGILYDKERLERGQSTSNVDIHANIRKIADIDAEISRLEGHKK